jgi:hypothetical protein
MSLENDVTTPLEGRSFQASRASFMQRCDDCKIKKGHRENGLGSAREANFASKGKGVARLRSPNKAAARQLHFIPECTAREADT